MPMRYEEKFSLTEFLFARPEEQAMLSDSDSGSGSPEHIRAWLEYRLGLRGYDRDGTKEAFEFYEQIWQTEYHKNGRGSVAGVRIGGDWMCSPWTTLKKGLKLIDGGVYAQFEKELEAEKRSKARGLSWDETRKLTAQFLLAHFEQCATFDKPFVWNFVYNALTRANLIIVPAGMNRARGGGKIQDYWDRTMGYVLPPAPVKPSDPLSKYAPDFQKLLDHFGIDGLCLGDWIEKDPMTNAMKPIPLQHQKPTMPEQWQELVEDMTRRIKSRRKAMERRLASLQDQ